MQVKTYGAPGAPGANGTSGSPNGGAGGAGGYAYAYNLGNGADTSNGAYAYGGAGGAGGNAYRSGGATALGGAGGSAGGAKAVSKFALNSASVVIGRAVALGGAGGNGGTGYGTAAGGAAGSAKAYLAATNLGSGGVDARTHATGGNAGYAYAHGSKGYGLAGAAAAGSTTAAGSGGTVTAATYVQGGTGASAGQPHGSSESYGGGGGEAAGSASATNNGVGVQNTYAKTVVTGGAGGSGYVGGGVGGNVEAASARAVEPYATGGAAVAKAYGIGGAGGRNATYPAVPPSVQGASAGGVYGVSAYAVGFDVRVVASADGGSGGYGETAQGGSVALTNAVSGVSGGGYLYAKQAAYGGSASQYGEYVGSKGYGSGGSASSKLNLTETHASHLTALTIAKGGGGPNSAFNNPGAGGSGYASVSASGSQAVSAIARSYGGYGGFGGNGDRGFRTQGGSATAAATASTTSKSQTAYAYALAEGGDELAGGGFGGLATILSTMASGYNAYAKAAQIGGSIADQYGDPGAASSIVNKVSGQSGGGYLRLSQKAVGGAGWSGIGGAANSSLTFDDTTNPVAAQLLQGKSLAYGGGAYGYQGTAGAATAYLKLIGTRSIGGSGFDARAVGGQGGYGSQASGPYGPSAGGAAKATSIATSKTTLSTDTTDAAAYAIGGAGGDYRGASAGPGGAANAEATASGGAGSASAIAQASGGAGSTQGAANATATAVTTGGSAATATATATGSSGAVSSSATTAAGPYVSTLQTQAQAPTSASGASAESISQAATKFAYDASGKNAYAFGSVDPISGYVSYVFSQAPKLGQASTPGAITGLGASWSAVFGDSVEGALYAAGATGAQQYVETQTYTLNGAAMAGHLVLGLIDSQTTGAGFSDCKFTVAVGGATVVSQDFTSLAAANAWFTDNPVDLGPVAPKAGLQVVVTLDVTLAAAGAGYAQRFLLGATDADPAPTLAAPTSLTAEKGGGTLIAGLVVGEPKALSTGQTITVEAKAVNGTLTEYGGESKVTGEGTNTLTLTGTVAQVNFDLARLQVRESTLSPDQITLSAGDSRTGVAPEAVIPVTVTTAGQTFVFTASYDDFFGGAGNDTFVAAANTLSAHDVADGGGGTNTLVLQGGGAFDLAAPRQLTKIQAVTATEGAGSARPIITLRSGLNVTLTLASGKAAGSGATVMGANDSSIIDLGAGTDQVTLGSSTETVKGGGGADTIIVSPATIGATIDGGTGKSVLEFTGGTATMGAGITDIHKVKLEAASAFTANALAGLVVVGSAGADTITAGASGQTLSGGAGADTLIGAGAGGDTFSDTVADLNGDTIENFAAPADAIVLTNMAAKGATLNWAQQSGGGVLTVKNGALAATIDLTGTFAQSDFKIAADGAGLKVTQAGGSLAAAAASQAFVQAMDALAAPAAAPHSATVWLDRRMPQAFALARPALA